MRKIIASWLLLLAAAVPFARADTDLGSVEETADFKTIPVRVSADAPDLNALAQKAFSAHGRYRLDPYHYTYDIRFALAGGSEVRVDVTRRDGESVVSTVVPGTNPRNALLRAADVAVERTNGQGLRGFFASKLAFIGQITGHDEVYVSDLFFTSVRRITSDRAIALSPRWSPDGSHIIYTSFYHSGAPDIFVMDLNDNQRTTFESFRGTNSGARFSPDGSRVAMVLSGEGSTEIYVSDAQGRRVRRLTRSDSVKASPCWSPDGSRIIFAGQPGPQLYVMSAGGGWPQRVTYGVAGYCAEPDWSRADPNKIVFTMKQGSYQIGVLDLSDREAKKVSHAPFDAIEPCWLPDGRHVVYTARDRYDNRVLAILDTETGKSTPISNRFGGSASKASVWSR